MHAIQGALLSPARCIGILCVLNAPHGMRPFARSPAGNAARPHAVFQVNIPWHESKIALGRVGSCPVCCPPRCVPALLIMALAELIPAECAGVSGEDAPY